MDVDLNLKSLGFSGASYGQSDRAVGLGYRFKTLPHSVDPCNEACDPGLCCGLSLADLLDGQEEFGLHSSTLEAARAWATGSRFVCGILGALGPKTLGGWEKQLSMGVPWAKPSFSLMACASPGRSRQQMAAAHRFPPMCGFTSAGSPGPALPRSH